MIKSFPVYFILLMSELNLQGKKLKNLQSVQMGQCSSLDVSNNLISNLEFPQENPNLLKLAATSNRIEEINGKDLKNVQNVREIDLSRNLLTKIENLSPLKQLETLDLSSNRIEVLENIEFSQKITKINASDNRIHSIFVKNPIQSLKYLNMSKNIINEFNYSKIFPNLTTLILDHCFLTSLIEFSDFKSLNTLSLSHNKICEDVDLELSNLQNLNVSHNNITSLSFIAKLQKLEVLDLSYNPLDDESIEIKIQFPKLRVLSISGTKISNLLNIPNLFPNIEEIDLKDTKGYSKEDVIEFVSKANSLLKLDIRGVFFDIPSNGHYSSFVEFQEKFGDDLTEYIAFRQSILSVAKNRPFCLDGIEVATENEIYEIQKTPQKKRRTGIPQTEVKNPKGDGPIHSLDDILGGKNAKQILKRLLQENDRLRMQLGLPQRSVDIDKLTDSEIMQLIAEIGHENEEFRQKLENSGQFDEKVSIVAKIMNINEKMKAFLEQRERRQIILPELDQTTIDSIILKLVDKNQRLRKQYEKMILINRNCVFEKCEIKILERAQKPMLPDEPTVVRKGSRQFNYVQHWIQLRLSDCFHLKTVVKLPTVTEFCIASDRYKWMQLAFAIPLVEDKIIVSDDLSILQPGKHKVLLCALDYGKQIVDYNQYSSIESFRIPESKNYDTLLFKVNDSQLVYVRSLERMVPIYSISLKICY